VRLYIVQCFLFPFSRPLSPSVEAFSGNSSASLRPVADPLPHFTFSAPAHLFCQIFPLPPKLNKSSASTNGCICGLAMDLHESSSRFVPFFPMRLKSLTLRPYSFTSSVAMSQYATFPSRMALELPDEEVRWRKLGRRPVVSWRLLKLQIFSTLPN